MRELNEGQLSGRPARVSPGLDADGNALVSSAPRTDMEIVLARLVGGAAVHQPIVTWHTPEPTDNTQGRWDLLTLTVRVAQAWGSLQHLA